ncbi:efflux RND transporter permease subunit [Thiovibrio sp. JS02]
MKKTLLRLYDQLILARPLATLVVTLLVVGFFAWQTPKFQLDASGDSLVLEKDADLRYHRRMVERYGSQDVLLLAYTAKNGDLFAPASLAALKALRDDLRQLSGVAEVTTILDIPLLYGSGISLGELADEEKIKTLEGGEVEPAAVKAELRENPLYQGRLLSADEKTTALLISLPADEEYRNLLKRRYELREKRDEGRLSPGESDELARISRQYREKLSRLTEEESRLVHEVRAVMARHRGQADLFLGGVPMIVADMIAFIKKDLLVFGLGVLAFLVITLTVLFRKTRWVLLPMASCGLAVLIMLGFLGLADWRVTVISSNFISLMIILTISLTIHVIVRSLEVRAQNPEASRRSQVLETVRTIALPCFYTTLTTIVAFFSLLVSDIRPVMDFGKMMTIGLMVSFALAFLLFPATVLLLKKEPPAAGGEDFSAPFTLIFARFTEKHGGKAMLFCVLLTAISAVGIGRLRVENRFIDYFRKDTEIHQGMSLIDRKLGGTTPLDLIIDFQETAPVAGEEDPFADDPFAGEENGAPWFADVYTMERLAAVHDYLAGLPETGEVLSIATAVKAATHLNNDVGLDNYELVLLNKKCPPDLKKLLISPYVSEEIAQARFTMRIIESDKNMERSALLAKIGNELTGRMGFEAGQIRFTNMFVLYNNMLMSLFRSQILTIGLVFLAILLMFVILFRSFSLALIATIPNLLPVIVVLGAMGWFSVSLDMMTITIASITIGIAVDDTIHYVHRFQREFPKDRDYLATMYRCHGSIGRAMYYTTVTITIGFSILVASSFLPTIYFGLFTGFAMLVALLADLILLPQLFLSLRPLGPDSGTLSK